MNEQPCSDVGLAIFLLFEENICLVYRQGRITMYYDKQNVFPFSLLNKTTRFLGTVYVRGRWKHPETKQYKNIWGKITDQIVLNPVAGFSLLLYWISYALARQLYGTRNMSSVLHSFS